MRGLLTAILLALGISNASANTLVFTEINPGGQLSTFLEFGRMIAASGDDIVIDGECTSACALLVLGQIPHSRVCLTERASFGLHLASTPGPDGGTPQPDPDTTDKINHAFYPKIVMDWIAAHGPLKEEPIYMRPDDFAGYFKICPSPLWD